MTCAVAYAFNDFLKIVCMHVTLKYIANVNKYYR